MSKRAKAKVFIGKSLKGHEVRQAIVDNPMTVFVYIRCRIHCDEPLDLSDLSNFVMVENYFDLQVISVADSCIVM